MEVFKKTLFVHWYYHELGNNHNNLCYCSKVHQGSQSQTRILCISCAKEDFLQAWPDIEQWLTIQQFFSLKNMKSFVVSTHFHRCCVSLWEIFEFVFHVLHHPLHRCGFHWDAHLTTFMTTRILVLTLVITWTVAFRKTWEQIGRLWLWLSKSCHIAQKQSAIMNSNVTACDVTHCPI